MYPRLLKHYLNHTKIHPRPVGFLTHDSRFGYSEIRSDNGNIGGDKDHLNFDYDYLCDPQNLSHIEKMIVLRKGVGGNIRKVVELYDKLQQSPPDAKETPSLRRELENEASKIPNRASPHLFEYGKEPKLLDLVNEKPIYNFKPKDLSQLGLKLDLLRTKDLGNLTGPNSYFFRGSLAELEQALIRYTISCLLKRGFTLMSVPDLLYSSVIERCGMNTKGERNQVYRLEGVDGDVCLSGTAEMSLGGYLTNRQYSIEDLPLRLAAVSRCFRAEDDNKEKGKGIYRVHGFTKVEMFGVTSAEKGSESNELYLEIIQIQKELFSQLGIHFQMLDMPLDELGAPAYSKVDIEAWMPGRQSYGEISSASNATDYQSRRLNVRYLDSNGVLKFAHTVNGTACAIPRMLIALCETFQSEDGTIMIPPILQPYMSGLEAIKPVNHVPCRMTWLKLSRFVKQD